MISAATGLVVLLGDPVGHSASPSIHNASFRALGLDLVYLACRVDADRLGAATSGLWALGATGANVTIPHKAEALRLSASASDAARALGAANTLVRAETGWHAENTDIDGFLEPLASHTEAVGQGRAVVFGAGGAARAVVYGLLAGMPPVRLDVVARRAEQAEALVADLAPFADRTDLRACTEADAVPEATLVVNATPLGMGDGRAPYRGPFRASQIVYDLVYRPEVTPLLQVAEASGAVTIGGLPMLLGQAAASFRLWTGREMPLGVARDAALATFA